MVVQRRFRVWERRDRRESRKRQNLGKRRPKELEETMLMGREGSIVSCAEVHSRHGQAPFFADIVLRDNNCDVM